MRYFNPLSLIFYVIWIAIILSNAYELIYYVQSYGMQAFLQWDFVFALLFLLVSIALLITVFLQRYKLFIIAFGVYVLIQVMYQGNNLMFLLETIRNGGLSLTEDWRNVLSLLINKTLFPISMLAYGILYITTLVFALRGRGKKNKFAGYTINCGYVILILNIASTILSFTMITTGFSFLDIALEILTTVVFTYVYIYTPRYFYQNLV